jgi:hypothetical protein
VVPAGVVPLPFGNGTVHCALSASPREPAHHLPTERQMSHAQTLADVLVAGIEALGTNCCPIPTSLRLPNPDEMQDGKCWWFYPETPDTLASWTLSEDGLPCFSDYAATHWLPYRCRPMHDPDFRALCAELADAVRRGGDSIAGSYWLLEKADAALSQPAPEPPTDEELDNCYNRAVSNYLCSAANTRAIDADDLPKSQLAGLRAIYNWGRGNG